MASGAWTHCRAIRSTLAALALPGTLLLSPLPVFAIEYSAESIEARVIDSQTQSPLEGVIVVAHWQLEGGLEGGNVLGQVKVLEAVTDASGVFKFPAWGPVAIARGLPANARLKDLDPELILFKEGYKFVHLKNTKTFEQVRGAGPAVRVSDWNGKTIKMTVLSSDIDEMAKELSGLDSSIAFATQQFSRCAWENMPKIIEAVHLRRRELEARGKRVTGWFVDQDLIANDENLTKAGCVSPKQIFGERLR